VGYQPSDLDELCAAGEVVWRGFENPGPTDGRIALYLTDHFPNLALPSQPVDNEIAEAIRELLSERGAVFFEEIAKAIGGFRNDVFDALWQLVWAGQVTNDTLAPLRSLRRRKGHGRAAGAQRRRVFRSRRTVASPGLEGRWSLLRQTGESMPNPTERQSATATQLVGRYGVLTREMVVGENVPGGFAGLYPVLKAMEESGRVRRGYFVAGLGAAQFAAPGADQQLRSRDLEEGEADERVLILAATDPANPYGAALRWPAMEDISARPQRVAGARVILYDGRLVGYLGRTEQQLLSFLPESEPQRGDARDVLVRTLADMAAPGSPVLLSKINGNDPATSELAATLIDAGFAATSRGYLNRGLGPPGS
jgi:ATP-dependent Lhr-like helicase